MKTTTDREKLIKAFKNALTESLEKCGEELEPKKIDSITASFCHGVSEKLGGSMVYFPKAFYEKKAAVLSEFTGDNQMELAQKHGLSIQHVYRIIRENTY